ncbi:MAG TPA: transglycosylase SLT domain-containing protein [Xanthobacteraceae bacterium]|nr:transglycosylase SLT domain-containing protein [Xanthobacteraceae bacterium]
MDRRCRLLVLFVLAATLGVGSLAGAKGTADAGKTDEKKPAASAGKSGGTTKAGKPGSAKHGPSKPAGSKASRSEGAKAKPEATKTGESKAGATKKEATKSSKREAAAKASKRKESKKALAKSRSSKSKAAKSDPAKEQPKAPPSRPTALASVDPGAVVLDLEPPSVSDDDIAALREAAGLIHRGRTSDASGVQASLRDPVARKLIEWMILRHESNGADFARYAAFIRSNPTWPSIPMFRRRAEGSLWHEHSDPATVRAFFADAKPASARGHFVLGRALIAQGQRAAGEALIHEGWRNEDFTDDLEGQVLEEFPHVLTRADHLARMHRRLYAKDFAAALRSARRLGDPAIAIVKVFSAVNAKSDNAGALLDAVPADARHDAAFALARVQWLMHKDRIADAARAALAAPRDPEQIEDADAWWRTRRMLVRKLLDAGDPQTAYRIAREAALPASENYRADHYFTAGWVALRFLDDPATALAHFRHVGDGIINPIALARASYWQGRAAEALGRHNEARAHYETAAHYPTAFYGQLARAKLGIAAIAMRRFDLDGPQRATIANLEVVRAAELLYAIGERELIIPMVSDLADRAVDPAALLGLAEVTTRHQDARATLLLGKAALGRGLPFDQYAFPNFGIPPYASVAPELDRSISYAIVRQESEFNQRDVSPAKAVGLMQVTPEAGRDTAKRFGAKYDWKRMVNDAVYNCQMGAAELSGLLVDYRGSYILTFAGYNAGRGRVREWIERHGDPRDPNVDPVDWIERIPFSETRNYVQRVMENFQMYRVRFGQAPRLSIEADLRRGATGN